jgi:hypothetical protein
MRFVWLCVVVWFNLLDRFFDGAGELVGDVYGDLLIDILQRRPASARGVGPKRCERVLATATAAVIILPSTGILALARVFTVERC